MADGRSEPYPNGLEHDVQCQNSHRYHLNGCSQPEGEHTGETNEQIDAVDEDAVEIVAVREVDVVGFGFPRTVNFVSVELTGTVEYAPIHPHLVVLLVWLVAIYCEGEGGRAVLRRDLWSLSLDELVGGVVTRAWDIQDLALLGHRRQDPVVEAVLSFDLVVPVDPELVKMLLADLTIESNSLVRNTQPGLPLPLDGNSDLLRGGVDQLTHNVDDVSRGVARVVPHIVLLVRGQRDGTDARRVVPHGVQGLHSQHANRIQHSNDCYDSEFHF